MPSPSSFLVLNIKAPVTFNIFTNERWLPGEKFQETRTFNEYAFTVNNTQYTAALRTWATLFRVLYEHKDWSQLHAFFSRRFTKRDMLVDRQFRKLHPPEEELKYDKHLKSVTVDIFTDTTRVELPKDFRDRLKEGHRMARGSMLGPDPIVCSLGSALGVGVGAGGFMDLLYDGNPPGAYTPRFSASEAAKRVKEQKQGGRGRTLAEWAELWTVIADWVYEYDTAMYLNRFLNMHTYKYRLSDAEQAECSPFRPIPRKYFQTDAIATTDAIRDFFKQLSNETTRFHGLEWDFLVVQADEKIEQAFYARFGRRDLDRNKNLQELAATQRRGATWREKGFHHTHGFGDISPMDLKPCPSSFKGSEWEAWMLSIEGGDVVVVHTLFQALWAVILLSHLPFTIKIMEKDERFPRPGFRDPDTVYI